MHVTLGHHHTNWELRNANARNPSDETGNLLQGRVLAMSAVQSNVSIWSMVHHPALCTTQSDWNLE